MHFDAPKVAPSAKFAAKRTPLSDPLNTPGEEESAPRRPAAGQKW
jgi:hypothetical protein